MCVAITLELKKHPGEKRSTLASQALKLCQLTRSVREAPDAAGHYYARACSLLSMRMFSEAVHDADARTCTPCTYIHMCILTCMACALHV